MNDRYHCCLFHLSLDCRERCQTESSLLFHTEIYILQCSSSESEARSLWNWSCILTCHSFWQQYNDEHDLISLCLYFLLLMTLTIACWKIIKIWWKWRIAFDCLCYSFVLYEIHFYSKMISIDLICNLLLF